MQGLILIPTCLHVGEQHFLLIFLWLHRGEFLKSALSDLFIWQKKQSLDIFISHLNCNNFKKKNTVILRILIFK